ncbi:Reduced growth phenotype protein 1 [Artemisia annua]|uniref:Reduced growth phenotype protein 1 n=1 Tax=Artemisia annua TaxID=35608 RepID=A0A2U1Q3V4_ARTAN|nr:Reduced growth phenotype protein 1 [Artemisia annua]
MPPPRSLSSLFGISKPIVPVPVSKQQKQEEPVLKLESDKKVYRPGDPVTITIQIRNDSSSSSLPLLVEKLSFEAKGVEKLDTQWFSNNNKPSPNPPSNYNNYRKRGEYVFMDSSVPSVVTNQILSSGTTRTYILRMNLPTIIPPSYRGSTVRYLYHVKSELSGKYINMEDGLPPGGSTQKFSDIEARLPLQIWVTEKTNGLLNEESGPNGIVPATPIFLDVYWKDMDAESEWARANETFDGVEEDYENSRDDVSSVSSYNPARGSLHKAFGSSLSLQSSAARSSKDVPYNDQRSTMSSYMALPRLSAAEVLYGSTEDNVSPRRSSVNISPNQQLRSSQSLSMDDDSRASAVPRTVEPVASEGFIRGRSYNIRLDDQVLLRFSPTKPESTYFFGDMIGGTLTFFHEEGTRRCLELSVTLELSETISRRSAHPSRRHSPTITKIQSDHHEVVADLVQTSFLFSVPMDGPMSFSTRHVSVQWVLRFEFFTTPKNVDWTRYEHPLLIDGKRQMVMGSSNNCACTSSQRQYYIVEVKSQFI